MTQGSNTEKVNDSINEAEGEFRYGECVSAGSFVATLPRPDGTVVI
jgi:hypothetical protein